MKSDRILKMTCLLYVGVGCTAMRVKAARESAGFPLFTNSACLKTKQSDTLTPGRYV